MCCCSRVPTRLTIRSSRRRFLASLKLAAVCAILVLHCCGRRGLTLALGAEKHSVVVLFAPQLCRVLLQCFSESLWARSSSVAARCALGLGLRDWAMACAGVWAAHFRLHGKGSGRARSVRLRFSATASGCFCSRVPSRLTIRSSRRRFLASLKLAVRRAILAHNRRGRRGLTQALGAEKHSAVLLRLLQFYRLRLQCSLVCFPARCSSVAVLCALGVCRFGFRQRRRVLLFLGSHAPNDSFKPTPCLGFVETFRRARNTGP